MKAIWAVEDNKAQVKITQREEIKAEGNKRKKASRK